MSRRYSGARSVRAAWFLLLPLAACATQEVPSGFVPIVQPITDPALGVGAAAGVGLFHEMPIRRPAKDEAPERLLLPTTTFVAGGATANGSSGGGGGHYHTWSDDRVRYFGAAGYGVLDLDWYGQSGALPESVPYDRTGGALVQKFDLQVGDLPIHAGLRQRFITADSDFQQPGPGLGIESDEFQSKSGGLGLGATYDSRDHPFSPSEGILATLEWLAYSSAFGGDFRYGTYSGRFARYHRLRHDVVTAVRFEAEATSGDVPFYDLPALSMRGLPALRHVDRNAVLAELELRYDATDRWSVLAFGGVGRTFESVSAFEDAEDAWSAGGGARYLVVQELGIRMGIDVARGPDETVVYFSFGTGWFRF